MKTASKCSHCWLWNILESISVSSNHRFLNSLHTFILASILSIIHCWSLLQWCSMWKQSWCQTWYDITTRSRSSTFFILGASTWFISEIDAAVCFNLEKKFFAIFNWLSSSVLKDLRILDFLFDLTMATHRFLLRFGVEILDVLGVG